MSNANAMSVPAHILARMEARKADPAKRSAIMDAIVGDGVDVPKLSTRGSRFRLVDQGVETVIGTQVDVIIVGANPGTSKAFFSKPFDTNNPEVKPDCTSSDGIRPDAHITAPVCGSCAACPNNVLGSKINPNGVKTKKCSDSRLLAVVAAADPTKVYSLSVPVSGMTALREYFKHLSNYGAVPEEVVTQLDFDEKADYPKLMFSMKAFLQEKFIPHIEKISASDETKLATRTMPQAERASTKALVAPPPAPVALPLPTQMPQTVLVPTPPPVTVVAPAPAPVAEDTTPSPTSDALNAALDKLFG